MPVHIKSPDEIARMRVAGRLAAEVLDFIAPRIRPGVTTGELDRLCVPENPLDILAQQCVATVATGDIGVEELLALVHRAHSFRLLPRADFDAVIDVLSEGVATKRGRRGAFLHLDRVHGRLLQKT